uniref:Uncharacterized protein n=1 Tax=Nelumbo nucifera TaxID=4432 RepID=A0A822YGV3_NELNU|nr:TPA_asm: hypothetical protein HUJ06_010588 [Nelumbo nucifera]
MVATFKECARFLYPLFKFSLLAVVECCMQRDHLAAMDQSIKLPIGNAPWLLCGSYDETTRKYLQSVKRLVTLCQ